MLIEPLNSRMVNSQAPQKRVVRSGGVAEFSRRILPPAFIDGIGDRRERNCPLLHNFGAMDISEFISVLIGTFRYLELRTILRGSDCPTLGAWHLEGVVTFDQTKSDDRHQQWNK